jgi:hypothetical protein
MNPVINIWYERIILNKFFEIIIEKNNYLFYNNMIYNNNIIEFENESTLTNYHCIFLDIHHNQIDL